MLALCVALGGIAATNTGTLTASVTGTCSTSGGTVPFGSYDTLSGSAVAAAGSLSLKCTRGTPSVTISLDNGLYSANAIGTTRAMSGSGAYLSYELYTTSGYTTVWNAVNTVSYAATSMAAASIPIYGQIPAGQDVPVSSYSDSVTATVNF